MTRITNFGRKRTHVEAISDCNKAYLEDFDAESLLEDSATAAVTNAEGTETAEDGRGVNEQPPKEKRKRGTEKGWHKGNNRNR